MEKQGKGRGRQVYGWCERGRASADIKSVAGNKSRAQGSR